MGRLQNLRVVDPVLTELARGYRNADFIGEKIFPVSGMSKEGARIPVFGKESFKIPQTVRAIRASSNRIVPENRTFMDVVLEEHDIEYPVDYREEDEDLFDLQRHATGVVSSIIALRHEKLCADLAQDADSYDANHVTVLSGTDMFSDFEASKPVVAVKDAIESVRKEIGRRPDTLWMGAGVYHVLSEHPALLEKVKYVQEGIVTPAHMAKIFGVKHVLVGESVYADADNNFADLWGNALGVCYVAPSKSVDYRDASFGYTLRKKRYPQVDTYDEKGGKLNLVRSTDIFNVKVLGPTAGYLYTNVV